MEGGVGLRSAPRLTVGHLPAAGAFPDGAADGGDVDGERETQSEPEVARDVHGGRNLRAHHESVLGTLADELHVLELAGTVADGAVESRGVAVGLEACQRTRVEAPEVALAARIFELDARRPAEGEGTGVPILAAFRHDRLEGHVDRDGGAGVSELAAHGEPSRRPLIHNQSAEPQDDTVAHGRGGREVRDTLVVDERGHALLGLFEGGDPALERGALVRRVPAPGGDRGRGGGGLLDVDDGGVVARGSRRRGVGEREVPRSRDGRGGDPDAAADRTVRCAGQGATALLGGGEPGRPALGSGKAALSVDGEAEFHHLAGLHRSNHPSVLVGLEPGQGVLGERLG